jgi:hypothetical protein
MTDIEREKLAREIVQEALRLWAEENKDREVIEMPDGDLAIPIEVGNRDSGFGYIYSHFLPISAARLIVQDCETHFNNLSIRFQDEQGQVQTTTLGERQDEDTRKSHIKGMAVQATLCVLLNLESRQKDALKENFEDSLVLVQAALHNNVAEMFNVTTDVGPDIKKIAKESGERREIRLRRFVEQPQLGNVQAIITHPGRPTEDNLTQKVAAAFKHLGKQASQPSVADYAGVSVRTLNNWAKGEGYPHWKHVEKHYLNIRQ